MPTRRSSPDDLPGPETAEKFEGGQHPGPAVECGAFPEIDPEAPHPVFPGLAFDLAEPPFETRVPAERADRSGLRRNRIGRGIIEGDE